MVQARLDAALRGEAATTRRPWPQTLTGAAVSTFGRNSDRD